MNKTVKTNCSKCGAEIERSEQFVRSGRKFTCIDCKSKRMKEHAKASRSRHGRGKSGHK